MTLVVDLEAQQQEAADGHYDALIAAWNNPTQPPPGVLPGGTPITAGMTTQEKCDAVNSWMTQPTGHIDVPIASVEGYMVLRGIPTNIEDWLADPANATPSPARTSGRELMRVIASPHVTQVAMSNDATYSQIGLMLGALEGVGLLTADQFADLMAMANLPPVSWWSTDGGLTSPVNEHDADAAGLS